MKFMKAMMMPLAMMGLGPKEKKKTKKKVAEGEAAPGGAAKPAGKVVAARKRAGKGR
jgi:hypothetical protein